MQRRGHAADGHPPRAPGCPRPTAPPRQVSPAPPVAGGGRSPARPHPSERDPLRRPRPRATVPAVSASPQPPSRARPRRRLPAGYPPAGGGDDGRRGTLTGGVARRVGPPSGWGARGAGVWVRHLGDCARLLLWRAATRRRRPLPHALQSDGACRQFSA